MGRKQRMRQKRGWKKPVEVAKKTETNESMPNNAEIAALNELLTTMNNPNIVGVEVPKGVDTKVTKATIPISVPPPPPPVTEELETGKVWIETRADPPGVPGPVGEPRRLATQKLFFTGRLKSGKDHCATAAGAQIFGFADPIYRVASHYFGIDVGTTAGKDIAGIRDFLQTVGQWGRGTVSEKYPLTTGRALFVRQVRIDGQEGLFGHPEVNWTAFGTDENLWLDGCILRATEFLAPNRTQRVAVTNCRFENEFKRLASEGYQHWHVMCSPKTWEARLTASKLTSASPAVKDLSEQLAAKLDQDVIRQVSAAKQGPMLRAIWADDVAPRPSERLHTVASFLKSL